MAFGRVPPRRILVLGLLLSLAVCGATALWIVSIAYRPAALKGRIVALLRDQLESEVSIETLEGSFFPRVALSGSGLTVREKGRTDVPPLLTVKRFEIRATLRELMKRPRHVSEVRLQGLAVHIPPGEPGERGVLAQQTEDEHELREVIVDRFEAPDTTLTLIPKNPAKQPKEFAIHHLVMDSVGRGQRIPFIAVLTNPVPRGEIETSGVFGPWDLASPAETPVSGQYNLEHADLDTIDGLSGILSSQGAFEGPLNRIRVE